MSKIHTKNGVRMFAQNISKEAEKDLILYSKYLEKSVMYSDTVEKKKVGKRYFFVGYCKEFHAILILGETL